jgi:two-component system, cell cycle response regulator
LTSNLNILMIEDNEDDVIYMKELLSGEEQSAYGAQEYQFQIESLPTIGEALEYLDQGKEVDSIILDLSLPDSKGLAGLGALAARVFEVPVIILTGLNDNEKAVQALQRGAQDYLIKGNISGDLLVRSIRYSIERHKLLSMLRNLSLIDELTNLYNRRGFMTIVDSRLKEAKREGDTIALYFVDIDRMKDINDRYGHTVGDQALIVAADVLRKTFREADILARIGGDEFAVFTTAASTDMDGSIKDRLNLYIETYNSQSEGPFTLALSIGSVYSVVGPEVKAEELLREADEEMYRKKKGKAIGSE